MSSGCSSIHAIQSTLQLNSTCFSLGASIVGASFLLLAIIVIISNTVVLLLVILNKKLRRSFFCLTINLAIADLLVGLLSMPLHSVGMMVGFWSDWKKVCSFFVFVDCVPMLASFFTTVAIAYTRHTVVKNTQEGTLLTRKQRNCVLLFMVWSLSMVPYIVSVVDSELEPIQLHGVSSCLARPSSYRTFAIIYTVFGHHIPSIMFIHYTCSVVSHVRYLDQHKRHTVMSEKIPSTQISTDTNSDSKKSSTIRSITRALRRSLGIDPLQIPEALWLAPITAMLERHPRYSSVREYRVMQVLSYTLVAHVAFWVPSFIMYDVDIALDSDTNFSFLRFLAYMNMAANPFLYAFSSEDFQRIYRETMVNKHTPAELAAGRKSIKLKAKAKIDNLEIKGVEIKPKEISPDDEQAPADSRISSIFNPTLMKEQIETS